MRLSEHGEVRLHSESGTRLLLLAGRPLGEPIVQYGPFVMNSREEIEQALAGKKTAKQALDSAVERGNQMLRQFEKTAVH